MAPKQLGFSKHEEEKKTVDGTSESEGSEYISDSGEENMPKPITESDDEESDSDSESNPKPKMIMSDEEEEESKEDKVISAPSKPKINPPPENTSNESDSSSSDSESTAMAPPPKKPKITPHEKPSNDEEERGIAMTTPPKPSHESSYDEDSDSESEQDKAISSPAKPNKINPPLESDSSSSDSESEEDKAISSPAKPNKINPPLESDDESDSSSSDSESEEDKAISSPAKPNKINPPLESDSSSSDSESEEDTHPPKKPNLSPPKTEEKEGGRSASGFIIMAAPKPLEASKPTKMFSDEDEVALLEALAAFWANGRNNRWAEFHLSVKDHLSRPFTKTQISEKIRRLKQKFEKIFKRARAKGGRLDISDPHESLLFELSKALWGDQKSTEENDEVGQEKAQGREKEWRALLVEELHLELKRIDLMKRDLRDHIRRLGSK